MAQDSDSICTQLAGVPSDQVPAALYNFFSDAVCTLLRSHGDLNSPPRDQTVIQKLTNPLQWLLFGGDPNDVLASFQSQGSASNFCGKVFKSGEPAYFCK